MKSKQFLLFSILALFVTIQLKAQTEPDSLRSGGLKTHQKKDEKAHQRNFVKVNLTAIALKNYSIQYERGLNKRFSIAVALRTMPVSTLPFKKQILKATEADSDADTRDLIESVEVGNFAFTPELRLYVGRGYGKGFYIAPFYRYATFTGRNLVYNYETASNPDNSIVISGKITAHTGGIMFGAQWPIGKYICLDWWILGPHYGKSSGTLTGVSSKTLSPNEQNSLRTDLEDFDLPLVTKTVSVNANGATVLIDGPWAGVRGGISLGVKF